MSEALALSLALIVTAAAPPASRVATTDNVATVSQCVVSLIDEVEVPARVAGVLMTLQLEDGTEVREGLRVTKKQLLGRLDDADALARQKAAGLEHQVSQAEAKKSESSIASADATVAVAGAEVQESEAVNRRAKGAVPPTQLRRQQLTEQRARMEADVARRDAETATLTVALREAQLEVASLNTDRHRIESPLDGTVVQRYRHPGEWVNPGDPIVRIVYLDRLRVEGFVDIAAYRPEEVAGRPVRVEVQFKNGSESFESTISYVSPLVELGGKYRVWAEVKNRDVDGYPLVRPGMSASMFISVGAQ
jgi:macrolide-specific efflux system membrane fusion protein